MRRFIATLVLTLVSVQAFSKSLPALQPGEIVPDAVLSEYGAAAFFSSETISDEVFSRMAGKSYRSDCTVSRDSLRYIRALHRDIEGRSVIGEMVVSASIAEDVLYILSELWKACYPIERMRLVDDYGADDETSMRANNSSSFNFRFISHTDRVSKHGKGMAVDINPLYNPYVKTLRDGRHIVEPETARPYVDRKREFPYKISRGDLCHRLFISRGFEWGGEWKSCKDYQHFEK